jgi:hypothetical protein
LKIICPKSAVRGATGHALCDERGAIGIKKGIQQGLQQGEIRVLDRQLTQYFGELPVWVEDRLQEAPLEQLELWGERLLEASRLEEVFEASSEH